MAKPGAEQSVHSDWKATQIKVSDVLFAMVKEVEDQLNALATLVLLSQVEHVVDVPWQGYPLVLLGLAVILGFTVAGVCVWDGIDGFLKARRAARG